MSKRHLSAINPNCFHSPVRMTTRRPSLTFTNPPTNVEINANSNVKRVAILTAGGLAPCLSSAVGGLIQEYTERAPHIEIILYKSGYKGVLLRDYIVVTQDMRDNAHILHTLGGSPCGNSRVKMTNIKDCVERGYVKEGQDPQVVAADNLIADEVDVLHTIGGDDTNTAAADLAAHLKANNYDLQVIGLPKTIDNDIVPVRQSLGAWTAAEEGAKFFSNMVFEHSSNPRMLIIHEVMGRACGYLTAATALKYQEMVDSKSTCIMTKEQLSVHAVYIPEVSVDLNAEGQRLKKVMDEHNCVNIFLSEGAGVSDIVADMEAKGLEIPRDAFGHVKLDQINPGKYFGAQFASKIGAEKVMVQKSGYFARSAPANKDDLRLIRSCTELAVACALNGESGLIGNDDEQNNVLRCIEFPRVKGHKAFNPKELFFVKLMHSIGQPLL